MEQNVSMKINELPSPTWNWLKVNETPIKWSNKIEPCEIAAEGDAVSTETDCYVLYPTLQSAIGTASSNSDLRKWNSFWNSYIIKKC